MISIRFKDRRDAGRRLAAALLQFRDRRPVVLALPRGGVPVGYEVALALQAPLDLVMVRKIGAPGQPELAVAAVVDGGAPELVVNESVRELLDVSDAYVEAAEARELAEIERRRAIWLRSRPPVALAGRSVIIVDDGIATGATARVAIKAVRRAGPARVLVAAPVAPPDTAEILRSEADEAVFLGTPEPFYGISMFYETFPQLSDEEVAALLERADAEYHETGGPA